MTPVGGQDVMDWVRQYVKDRGFTLSPDNEQWFADLVARTQQESGAEQAYRTLLDEMIQEGKKGFAADGVLRETTREAALRKLCPLFPIC